MIIFYILKSQKFCTECGALLETGTKFCTECGAMVEDEIITSSSSKKSSSISTSINQTSPTPTKIIVQKTVPRSGGWLIFAGYFSFLFMFWMPFFLLVSIILGFYLWLNKTTLSNGKQVKTYTTGTQINGIIFIIFPVFIFFILLITFIIINWFNTT